MHGLAHAKAPGQVAQRINAPPPRDGLFNRACDVALAAAGRPHQQLLVACAAEGLKQVVFAAVDQNQALAAVAKYARQRAAQIAGGPGDQHGVGSDADHRQPPWAAMAPPPGAAAAPRVHSAYSASPAARPT